MKGSNITVSLHECHCVEKYQYEQRDYFFKLTTKKIWKTRIFVRGHDDVIKWKHFPRYWPFVRGIHRSPVNSPHKGQWRGALMFSLICVWINDWVNNREAGDLRLYRTHYDVIVMVYRWPMDSSHKAPVMGCIFMLWRRQETSSCNQIIWVWFLVLRGDLG